MRSYAGTLVPLALAALLALFCIPRDATSIQSLLQAGAARAIAAAPVPGVTVQADGRDLVLTGTVPSEAAKTTAAQAALVPPGVRSVDNRLQVVAPPPPGPSAQAVTDELQKVLLDRRIEFQPAQAVISPSSTPVLDEILAVLNKAPSLQVTISGHTDNSGDAESNRALSRARAQAVVTWLVSRGVPAARLAAEGFGPDRPLGPNDSPAARARNRRVEISAR